MMSSRLFSCICFVVLTTAASAQIINIEGLREGIDEKQGWAGACRFEIAGNSGNTDRFNAGVNLLGQHQREGTVNLVSFLYDYGEALGTKNIDRKVLHLRHTRDLREALAGEAFTQVQRNDFTRLSSRTLLGGGLRWDLLEADARQDGNRLFLGTGLFGEHEAIRSGNDESAVRANLYLSTVYPVFDDSKLSGTIYYQPAFDDPSNYRAFATFSLSVPMKENLSIELSFNLEYDSQPPASVQRTDISYRTGIRWTF